MCGAHFHLPIQAPRHVRGSTSGSMMMMMNEIRKLRNAANISRSAEKLSKFIAASWRRVRPLVSLLQGQSALLPLPCREPTQQNPIMPFVCAAGTNIVNQTPRVSLLPYPQPLQCDWRCSHCVPVQRKLEMWERLSEWIEVFAIETLILKPPRMVQCLCDTSDANYHPERGDKPCNLLRLRVALDPKTFHPLPSFRMSAFSSSLPAFP